MQALKYSKDYLRFYADFSPRAQLHILQLMANGVSVHDAMQDTEHESALYQQDANQSNNPEDDNPRSTH